MISTTSVNTPTQRTELLSRKEEHKYIEEAQAGNKRALRKLIDSNQGLIRKEAYKHRHHVDWDVLMASGVMGVVKAVEGFNLSTGNKFSSYAVPVIRTEIRDCAARETGIGRIIIKHLGKNSKASSDLSHELDRDPTLEEIAERCGLSQQQVLNALERKDFTQPFSLNQQFGDDSLEWLDLHEDGRINVWHDSENVETLDLLNQLERHRHLDSRQVRILIAKYQGYTNAEIGEEFGVSKERIRQLFNAAKEKFAALVEGDLWLIPDKLKARIADQHNSEKNNQNHSPSIDLPVPKQAREPSIKRVDALRLGGRIRRTIRKYFSGWNTHNNLSHFADQLFAQTLSQRFRPIFITIAREVAHAQKFLLVLCRRSIHGPVAISGYQSDSENQRRRGLGKDRKPWQRCLEFGQEKIQRPIASVYQSIRGFNSKFSQWRERTHFSLRKTFECLGIGQGVVPPRPPTDHQDSFSTENDSSKEPEDRQIQSQN